MPDYRQIPDKLIAGLPVVSQEKEISTWSKKTRNKILTISKITVST